MSRSLMIWSLLSEGLVNYSLSVMVYRDGEDQVRFCTEPLSGRDDDVASGLFWLCWSRLCFAFQYSVDTSFLK